MSRKILFVAMATFVVIALMWTANAVAAQTSPTSGSTLPYSARLADSAGQPVNDGQYDFLFNLYASEKGEQVLWSEAQSAISVKSGGLNVTLGQNVPLPPEVASLKELWLSVSVRGPQDQNFTLLNERVDLKAQKAVTALTCAHSHFTDDWDGTNNYYGIRLSNGGTGDGLRVYSYSTNQNYAAIWAVNAATTGYGTAIYASSNKGVALQALSAGGDAVEAVASTAGKSAVYAHGVDANGLWGASTNGHGAHGWSETAVGTWGGSNTGYGVEGFNNHDTSSAGNYGGYFTSNNYRGAFIGTLQTSAWYGAIINGGLSITNGSCTGCTLVYVGRNQGEAALQPGDMVAAAGVEVDAGTNQPVLLVRLATDASDPIIGIVVGGTSAPGEATSPDKIQSARLESGAYVQVAVSGLVQARVADKSIAIGDRLVPGPAGAIAAAAPDNSVARVMSTPDENGLVWVMVDAH